jgi:hypothetical protein
MSDIQLKETPYTVRLGFSTQVALTGRFCCPNCQIKVRGLHQPFKYIDLMVCAFCFDKVREQSNILQNGRKQDSGEQADTL